jgi:hypothetical protein
MHVSGERCPHCGGVVKIEGNDAVTNFLPSLYWWCDACRRAVYPVRDEGRVQHEEGELCT